MDICVCIVIVLPPAVVCSLGEYIQLQEVVQIQYTLDIHGTTITCKFQVMIVYIYYDQYDYANAFLCSLPTFRL